MTEPLTKKELISQLQIEHSALESLLRDITDSEKLLPGTCGAWSVKDVMAHITFWEQTMMGWYRKQLVSLEVDANLPAFGWDEIDALNRAVFEKHWADPLQAVQDAFEQSFTEVSAFINSLDEDELFEKHHFEWLGEYILVDLVLNNTLDHYREHYQAISTWKNHK